MLSDNNWLKINKQCERQIRLIADGAFLLGATSVVICIIASGGISNYLALGSQTRGVGKDATSYISSDVLPLITLSNIILLSPYLYKYLLSFSKKKTYIESEINYSFMLAVVYLLYNQGRLPLLLFFVPFILDTKIAKKAKISFLIFLVVLAMPILNILPSIFKYLTYGYWKLDLDSTIVHTLLLEFTYPLVILSIKANW